MHGSLFHRLARLAARKPPALLVVCFEVAGEQRVSWRGQLVDAATFQAQHPHAELHTVMLSAWPAERWGTYEPA